MGNEARSEAGIALSLLLIFDDFEPRYTHKVILRKKSVVFHFRS